MSFFAWWLVVLWGQMYVSGCLNKSQHGSRSTRFPYKLAIHFCIFSVFVIRIAYGQKQTIKSQRHHPLFHVCVLDCDSIVFRFLRIHSSHHAYGEDAEVDGQNNCLYRPWLKKMCSLESIFHCVRIRCLGKGEC